MRKVDFSLIFSIVGLLVYLFFISWCFFSFFGLVDEVEEVEYLRLVLFFYLIVYDGFEIKDIDVDIIFLVY